MDLAGQRGSVLSEVEDPCQRRHRLAETWPTFETASLVVLGLLKAVQEQ